MKKEILRGVAVVINLLDLLQMFRSEFLKVCSTEPWGSTKPVQGLVKVKTIFIIHEKVIFDRGKDAVSWRRYFSRWIHLRNKIYVS